MILKETEIKQSKLNPIIGKQVEFNFKKINVSGTTSFFLKKFELKKSENEKLKINSKCSFQLYEEGLLLHSNYSNKLSAIPIRFENLKYIKLIRGIEVIKPFTLSPMWILMKLGVSVLYARYFQIYFLDEYNIGEMQLIIETSEYRIEMIKNSYTFERQAQFFRKLDLGEKIIIDTNNAYC